MSRNFSKDVVHGHGEKSVNGRDKDFSPAEPGEDGLGESDDFDIEDDAEIDQAIKRLKADTRQLRLRSNSIITTTVFNLLVFFTALARGSVKSPTLDFSGPTLIGISALATASVIIFSVRYDRALRHGDVVFEEISEELQVQLRETVSSSRATSRPRLGVRLAMREFSLASRLPIIKNKQGALIYSIFNLTLTLFAWLVIYLNSKIT